MTEPLPAPSTQAASSWSPGIVCSAARKKAMANGLVAQVLATITADIAPALDDSQ
ncbi:MAG: hypothetical protein P1P87_03100 [Trueperaceae bacterium]|nr:hypothetical protein [Trueperaceae bacterium]